MPNPTFPFMRYGNELWDLPENNWLGLFWLNSILFFLWQNVQPQTTLSPHPSSALMIFTSTFILPAGTCHNSTIKIRTILKRKRKLPTTSSATQTVDHPLWHHSWKKIRRFSFSYWANTAPHKEPCRVFCPVAYLCIPCPNQESARDINKNWVDPSGRNALEETQ